jgi:hypothetical protein
VAHTLKRFTEEEANEEDGQAIDRELERVQQLKKEKDRFANQLEAKKKDFGKARKNQSSKRTNRNNAKRNQRNERTIKQFTVA